MFKLSDLPDNRVIDQIRSIERDLTEFKSAQRVGSSSLQIKYSQSSSTWDINESVSGSLTFVRWRVTFTPTHGGTPYAELGFNYQLTPADPYSTFEAYPDPLTVGGGGVAFLIAFTNNSFGAINVKLKCGIKCVDTGTLSFVRSFQV